MVEKRYLVYEISNDGLLKEPYEENYGHREPLFYATYSSIEEASEAIDEYGDKYTNYIVVASISKRI